MIRSRIALLVVLAAISMGLLACSASGETSEPSETPTPGPSERFQPPSTLESYRFTVEIELSAEVLDQSEAPDGLALDEEPILISIEGRWTSGDREYSNATFSLGVLSGRQETIRIGDRIWTSVSGGAWREQAPLTSPEGLVGQTTPLSPDVLFGRDDAEFLDRLTTDLRSRPHTTEMVDGRATNHWTLDEEWFEPYSAEFEDLLSAIPRNQGLNLQIDLWGDIETGVGTRLEITGGLPGGDEILSIRLRLFDMNDPEITVEEPIGAIGR